MARQAAHVFPSWKEEHRLAYMEKRESDAHEALEAVQATRELNAERIRRPRQYWIMMGALLSILALLPYASEWPAPVNFLGPPALMLLIGGIAAWRQPSAVRKIRFSGFMALNLLVFALSAGVIVIASRYAYAQPDMWWAPGAGALLVFVFTVTVGPWMDRSWSRRMSYGEK